MSTKIVIDGEMAEIGGSGIPAGGTDGQVLAKASDDNYDVHWTDMKQGDTPVGKSMEGMVVKPTQDSEVTAGVGAEIFNNYQERVFNNQGIPNKGNVASGNYSHAEGRYTTASGNYSHAEGSNTTASGTASHAEGQYSTASGTCSHAEDFYATASGDYSHAEGSYTTASGHYSHAEGSNTTASGNYSHAEGRYTTASGRYSHVIGSANTGHYHEFVMGVYAVNSNAPDTEFADERNFFVIGNGSSETSRANIFRVSSEGVYGTSAFKASGADYAEMFEWEDGNPQDEDRVGHFVTIRGDKISLARPGDFILGVVSGNPTVVGDDPEDQWRDMFLTDIFGRPIYEDVEVPDVVDDEGEVIEPVHMEHRWKLNPDYDYTKKYIGRQNRSEWSAIGLMGKLVVIDDGTCRVDGWATTGEDGIATDSDAQTRYRVLKRLDSNHIQILIL